MKITRRSSYAEEISGDVYEISTECSLKETKFLTQVPDFSLIAILKLMI